MTPDLRIAIARLSASQRDEFAAVLHRVEATKGAQALAELTERDLLELVDAIEQPPPPPATLPIYELMDVVDDRTYRSLQPLLAPIAAQCPDFLSYYVAPVPITALPAGVMVKVEAARVEFARLLKQELRVEPNVYGAELRVEARLCGQQP